MKQTNLLCVLLFIICQNYAGNGPTSGTSVWNIVAEDLVIDNIILSKVCVTESIIDALDPKLMCIESAIDLLLSKIATLDTGFVSIYGSKIVDNTFDNVSVQFQYGIPSTVTTTTLVGGTFSTNNSLATLNTSGSVGSVSQLQTNNTILYRSGHEAYAFFSVAFTGDMLSTSSQFIGPIDSLDGFAVGFDGPTFGVTRRDNGVNTFTAQSNFNQDPLDGTGPSGFIYDPTKLNVFRISYGYLGASIIKFQIMTTNGDWILFHIIEYPNTSTTLSITQPFLPITARVEDLTGTHTLSLSTGSWNAGIIATSVSPSSRYHDFFNTSAGLSIVTGSETYNFAIRNMATFNGKPNKIQVRIASGWGNVGSTGGTRLTVRLIKNPSLTGATFTPIDSANSVVAVATNGTYTSGVGTQVWSFPLASSASAYSNNLLPKGVYDVILLPGETIAVVVLTGALSVMATSQICIGWEEQF